MISVKRFKDKEKEMFHIILGILSLTSDHPSSEAEAGVHVFASFTVFVSTTKPKVAWSSEDFLKIKSSLL